MTAAEKAYVLFERRAGRKLTALAAEVGATLYAVFTLCTDSRVRPNKFAPITRPKKR